MFSRHWLHVGMVGLDGTKMSKSLGNLVFVADLLKEWDPMALRLALLAHHYRTDWDWERADVESGAERLERWRAGGDGAAITPSALAAVRRCVDDDLHVDRALAVLDEEAAAGRAVTGGAALLGVEV
jgi:L-cysteine:1D-myo-inositol 2-amino-2-deoxy-alpha-D-glucopyranoside ligase